MQFMHKILIDNDTFHFGFWYDTLTYNLRRMVHQRLYVLLVIMKVLKETSSSFYFIMLNRQTLGVKPNYSHIQIW